jgi:hypothetical protein
MLSVLGGAAILIAAAVGAPAGAGATDLQTRLAKPAATKGKTIRFATFNASLNRNVAGELIANLSTPDDAQARAVAEIIQRVDPDVLLINEFDYDADGDAARLFQENYLGVSQNGADPVQYAYMFNAPSNTGIASGFDLNNNGMAVTTVGAPGYGDDAFGFGNFPGQYGMLLLSKYPLDIDGARTFQKFLWKDMPGALLPVDPTTGLSWYSAAELAVFRLSSKSHWDVPVQVDGQVIHVLASHPTPPVFDGPEDRNGTRNYDEIRFWVNYISRLGHYYIYDDKGQYGGLPPAERFVLMGDLNSDPLDGDSIPGAAQQLLRHPRIHKHQAPTSEGGPEQAMLQGQNNLTQMSDPVYDTADFSEAQFGGPGNVRADYVLPCGLNAYVGSGVFWPATGDPLYRLTGPGFPAVSSDHRLVWVDVRVQPSTGAPPNAR